MVGEVVGRMEEVVEELRAKLRAVGATGVARDLPEARLELACTWGSGHLLLTGSDRDQVDGLLNRVIRKVDPMGTVRARAGDPASTVDRLIALLDSEKEVTGHLDRRKALLQLLARAQEARKSIFVVVDDADAASVEQLERLRTTLEVAPDAIERLRLVLVGDVSLPTKLDSSGARALSSRITSRIRVGLPEDVTVATPDRDATTLASPGSLWTFAVAAAVSFAVISYATVLLLSAPEGLRFARVASPPAPDAGVVEPTRVSPIGTWQALSGNEQVLDSPLGIPIDSRWVTGSALFAVSEPESQPQPEPKAEPVIAAVTAVARPTAPAAEVARAPAPAPEAVSRNPARKRTLSSIGALAALMAKKQVAAAASVRPETTARPDAPTASSSIAALRSHFK